MEPIDIVTLLIFSLLLYYNKFRLRMSPKINFVDITVWLSFIVGIIPLAFTVIDLVFEELPDWVFRFETEEFFSSSALLLASLVLAINQFEADVPVRYRRLIYLLTVATVLSGLLYLFMGHNYYWNSTLLVYNIEGIVVGLIGIRFVENKILRNLFMLLLIAFIFGLAIFFYKPLFMIGVMLYLASMASILYMMISEYIFV